ncbi:hypothetical protein DFH07DRAFT_729394, partial [Mycena maculata]
YVPSCPEILEIRALLGPPADELARFDVQIGEMEAALAELKGERDSLKTAIDAHRALISTIRRTPEDIFREIFLSCSYGSRRGAPASGAHLQPLAECCVLHSQTFATYTGPE